ncbi:MAG: hypothetical protein DRR19_19665 [Candidatus Parabeggiatoa sp. nov. 1]|nr:MAG: hypothetical protein DRR19_19665 [Gammaproteobacteria bacterium]
MREMTGLRVEAFAGQQGVKTNSCELVDEKYAQWAAGSEKQSATRWETAAWERYQRIPSFVRGMVILEVERCAKEMGENTVTDAVVFKPIWGKGFSFGELSA